MKYPALDLVGKTFGRLTVLGPHSTRHSRTVWTCRCVCGEVKTYQAAALQSGDTKSCGCLRREDIGSRRRTHGRTNTLEFRMWLRAKERSKKYGLTFTLTLDDIPRTPKRCPVLGISLGPSGRGAPLLHGTPSLDRIFPEQGYIPGNIRVISWRANQLKNNASFEELQLLWKDAKRLRKTK